MDYDVTPKTKNSYMKIKSILLKKGFSVWLRTTHARHFVKDGCKVTVYVIKNN